jgi:hypothetical protein
MGFNQCYLRDVEDLQSELSSVGLESFVIRYSKYDSWCGSSESMEFLENKINLYENIKNNDINFINSFN